MNSQTSCRPCSQPTTPQEFWVHFSPDQLHEVHTLHFFPGGVGVAVGEAQIAFFSYLESLIAYYYQSRSFNSFSKLPFSDRSATWTFRGRC